MTKFLAHYDSVTGVVLERRPVDLQYPDKIPEPAIELDENTAKKTMAGWRIDVSKLPAIELLEPVPVKLSLDDVKAAKTAELWAAGDELLRAIDGRIVSQSDRENAAAHQQGIADIEAGRDTPFAAAVKLAAEQAGRAVEDLIAAHKRHMVAGVFLRSLISGEQNRVTALLKATQTVEEAEAVQWTMTAEQAMTTVQAKLQALAQ